MAGEDRSQQATPRRKQEARKRGQVARSRELAGAVGGLAVVLALGWQSGAAAGIWKSLFTQLVSQQYAPDGQAMNEMLATVGGTVIRLVAIPFALVWSATMLSSLAQGGLVWSVEPLLPKWQRISPLANLKNLFSMTALGRTLKSLIPAALILGIAVALVERDWAVLLTSSHGGVRALFAWIGERSYEIARNCSLVLLAWAVADYALQRYQFSQSLRMTRQEVTEESKETEGNPFTRNRIRRRQREIRNRWSMKDVERATAIVVNPQHLAIALEYRPETMAAPMVVAKGMDDVALRIKDFGRWHGIPIVENPPLAQALYRATEVGETIPAKLYAAVAEILAFIYRTQAGMRNSMSHVQRGPGDHAQR